MYIFYGFAHESLLHYWFISSKIPCHSTVDHRLKTDVCIHDHARFVYAFVVYAITTDVSRDSRRECTLFSDEAREHTSRPTWKAGGSSFNSMLHLRNGGPRSLFVYRVARKRRSVWRRCNDWLRATTRCCGRSFCYKYRIVCLWSSWPVVHRLGDSLHRVAGIADKRDLFVPTKLPSRWYNLH